MRNRLSIFSFNTLTFFPFATKAAIIAFVVCLSTFLGIHIFYIDIIKSIKTDEISKRIHILNTAKEPKLVFWGSSRLHSCIDEKTFARNMGVYEAQIINLSGFAMEPWEYLCILRNADTKIAANTIAIIEIEPWTFNKNKWRPVFHEPIRYSRDFPRWANLWERLNYPYPYPEDRWKMVFGHFTLLGLRDSIYEWAYRIKKSGKKWPKKIPEPVYHEDREIEISQANSTHFKAEIISRDHMKDYQFCEYKKKIFEQLLSLLSQKKYRIVIVHPPVRKEYYNYVLQSPKLLLEYHKHEQYLKYLTKNYHCIIWKIPEDMGLTSSVFVDYGHFNKEGCVMFSKKLGIELKKLFQE